VTAGDANVELKAHCFDVGRAVGVVQAHGGHLICDHQETDTFFVTATGRLKYSESADRPSRLVAYHRTDSQEARRSDYEIADVRNDGSKIIRDTLAGALGTDIVVDKHRRTFAGDNWLINIDSFLGHDFIEIEVPITGAEADAQAMMAQLTSALGVTKLHILPQSYAQLAHSIPRANSERLLLGSRLHDLVLIDGPSGVGKSTLVHALRQQLPPDYRFLKRYTCRQERSGDEATDEYNYIPAETFQAMVHHGDFLESKDFLFGMSYGISWNQVKDALQDQHVDSAYGLMNLGNIRHIKEFTPEVKCVLITAPIDELRGRLEARGTHTPDALAERLDNAKMASDSQDLYDHVINNADGLFDASLAQLTALIQATSKSA